MDPKYFLSWRVALLLVLLPCGHFLSVRIVNKEPVYVMPENNLVLKARIEAGPLEKGPLEKGPLEKGPLEKVSSVTWAWQPETGLGPGWATLATCPAQRQKCAGTSPNVTVSVGQLETELQINKYDQSAGAVYSVTVTDLEGTETTAQCIVRKYEPVYHVSVSINVSGPSLVCGEAWGTEPKFSWSHERTAVTATVGRVSKDGTTLYVTKTPICGHFTCTVSNQMSHSSASYTAAPCDSEGGGTTAAVVCLVILLLLFGSALAVLMWRRRYRNRRQRLHEHLDDTM